MTTVINQQAKEILQQVVVYSTLLYVIDTYCNYDTFTIVSNDNDTISDIIVELKEPHAHADCLSASQSLFLQL